MKKALILLLFTWSQFATGQQIASKYYSYPVNQSDYTQEYQAVLDYAAANGIKQPRDAVKTIQNNHMADLVNSGAYAAFNKVEGRYMYHVWNGDTSVTKAFMAINWIDPDYFYAEEVDTVNFIPYTGITSDGNASYFDPNYQFFTSDTSWLYNDFSIGAYISHAESADNGNYAISGRTRVAPNIDQQRFHVRETANKRFNTAIGSFIGTTAPLNTPILITLSILNDTMYSTNSNSVFSSAVNTSNYPSRYGKIAILAQYSTDYAISSDTINPIDSGAVAFFTDTLTHTFAGPHILPFLEDINTSIATYNSEIGALNDTINVTSNLYLPDADSNNVLPLFPRLNAQYGNQFQLPRAHPDSFAIYRVTNDNYDGQGSFKAIIDSCENDGLYDFVIFETAGLTDTNYFSTLLINEDKGIIIYAQTAPSPGFRLHGYELNLRSESAPVFIQHLRFGAGTDTLPGVARDSCVANCVFDSVQGRLVGWTQFSERDCMKASANNVVLDHCTFNFSTDELLQSRGSNQTYSHLMFSKPLAFNQHHKGEHPKGSIHFKQGVGEGKNIAFWRNLYVGTFDRTPQIGGQIIGVLQENYAINFKFGIQVLTSRTTYADDTLGGGVSMNINNIYADNSERFAFRMISSPSKRGATYVKNFDVDRVLYTNPYDSTGILSGYEINFTASFQTGDTTQFNPDSSLVDEPVRTLKSAPLIRRNAARKFISFYAGARPADRDTVEKQSYFEALARLNVDPPKNMDKWLPLLRAEYSNPTTVNHVLPNDSLTVDSTGYLGIERWADSLHWKVTYPDSIPWPGLGSLPADTLPADFGDTAVVAYSLRYVTSTYSGPVIRVRRSSDNAELDFKPQHIGDSLTSWVGAGNDGFVATWYDQIDTNDATQGTAANQPQIVDNGSLILDPQTNKPALKGDGSQGLSSPSFIVTQPATKFTIGYSTASNVNQIWSGSLNSNARHQVGYNITNGGEIALFAGAVFNPNDTNTENLLNKTWLAYSLFNGSSSELGVNGNTANIGSAGSQNNEGYATPTSFSFRGYLSEDIYFDSDQSSNRAAIESNINEYYSIY